MQVPVPASPAADTRILELAVTIPPGAVVEIRSGDGASLGSISPFGHSGPGVYQIVVSGLPAGGAYTIALKASNREAGTEKAAPAICVEYAKFLSL